MMYLFIVFTVSLSGCFQTFYKTNTKSSIDAATASKLSKEKHFIIHFSNSVNPVRDAYVSNDTLYGKIESLTRRQIPYAHPDTATNKNPAKAKDKADVLTEVHLCTNAELPRDSVFTANVSSFTRADVYELNQRVTNTNHILSFVGIGLTIAVIALICVAAGNSLQFSIKRIKIKQTAIRPDENNCHI